MKRYRPCPCARKQAEAICCIEVDGAGRKSTARHIYKWILGPVRHGPSDIPQLEVTVLGAKALVGYVTLLGLVLLVSRAPLRLTAV